MLVFRWPIAVIVGMVLFCNVGCGGKIPAPKSYKRWNAKDGSFSVDYPAEWQADGGGKQGIQWAEFTSGNAQIRINLDVSSSLVGDIAGGQAAAAGLEGADEETKLELAPVSAAHRFNMEASTQDMEGYKEEKAAAFNSQLGDGRKSVFKSKGSFGSAMRGYRATALTNNRGLRIICICPAKNWETLQPAFDKILASLGPGEQSG